MATLKPNKPEAFDGKRELLAVNAWVYQLEQYFMLVQVGVTNLTDQIRIGFASSLMKSHAARWWYMQIQNGTPPTTWSAFVDAIRKEFIPQNASRQARDKLRRLSQKTSVSAYLNEFQNTVISIPGMTTEEMIDRFVGGLKPQTRLEVLKASPTEFSEASSIALNVDNALYSSFSSGFSSGLASGNSYAPMDIGNVNAGERQNGRGRTSNDEQRQKDIRNKACFVCHKKGCWASRHGTDDRRIAKYNNAEICGRMISDSDSESEN